MAMATNSFWFSLGIIAWAAMGSAFGQIVYSNDFNQSPGTRYPEWTSSQIEYASTTNPPGAGTLPAQTITNADAPSHAQRFLGEFGGPVIGAPGDPGYNHTRVQQTVRLTLNDLPLHRHLRIAFDLYILKSWDGNSPMYGPDRWSFGVGGRPPLLATTFSNNPKVEKEGCYQDYPRPSSPPRSGAVSTNTFGFRPYFGDSVYHLEFVFEHSDPQLVLEFAGDLFEGKGVPDESWGLDNVEVSIQRKAATGGT